MKIKKGMVVIDPDLNNGVIIKMIVISVSKIRIVVKELHGFTIGYNANEFKYLKIYEN